MKNHRQNLVEKLFPDTFLKHQNWACLWINNPKFYMLFVSIIFQLKGYRNVLKLSRRSLAFTWCKAFFNKQKEELIWNYSAQFLKKDVFLIFFYWLNTFDHYLVVFTLWNIGQYVYRNYFLTRLAVISYILKLT